jgi:hypothetical protein
MLAYRYDENTKEFKYAIKAQKDPIGKEYLLPANSTFTEPPDKIDGYIQVYIPEEDTWKQELDHRGHYEVKLSTFEFDIVNYIGDPKDGYCFVDDEVYENYIEDKDRYKIEDGQVIDIIDTDEYREIKHQEMLETIAHLKCTKRVLALMLQEIGITYTQLKSLIATNEQAQLEWDLCIELERCNPLLDIMGEQLGLSHEQIDQMFKYANGWVDTLEVE